MKNKTKWIIGTFAVILLLGYLVFAFTFPLAGEMTEGRPIVRELCGMQYNCHLYSGEYTCGYGDSTTNDDILMKSPNYRGCNVSSPGFREEQGTKWVVVEFCSCGGLTI